MNLRKRIHRDLPRMISIRASWHAFKLDSWKRCPQLIATTKRPMLVANDGVELLFSGMSTAGGLGQAHQQAEQKCTTPTHCNPLRRRNATRSANPEKAACGKESRDSFTPTSELFARRIREHSPKDPMVLDIARWMQLLPSGGKEVEGCWGLLRDWIEDEQLAGVYRAFGTARVPKAGNRISRSA